MPQAARATGNLFLFNGAALLKARKAFGACGGDQRVAVASTGHAFESAEGAWRRTTIKTDCKLQRGRAFESAEGDDRGEHAGIARVASTGPRF
ncbi:MAG: hypothetical protein JWL90_3902 [Chthoniobacteraceae bacterium]|nr:hypothetical protein [Chthoniobacteraceae bacterium]